MKREDYERLRQALDQPFGTCVNMESIMKRFPGWVGQQIIHCADAGLLHGSLTALCMHAHTNSCSVQHETLLSIYSQETQNKVIRSNHVHKRRIGDYCAR